MPKPDRHEIVAREIIRRAEAMARKMAPLVEQTYDTRALSPQDELDLWRFRDPKVDEPALWAQGMPMPQIAEMVFPHRKRLIQSGGRLRLSEQVAYAERMALKAEQADRRERQSRLSELPDLLRAVGPEQALPSSPYPSFGGIPAETRAPEGAEEAPDAHPG